MDVPTIRIIFEVPPNKIRAIADVDAFSYGASLVYPAAMRKMGGLPKNFTMLHRFEESIGGRSYVIEVKPVELNRWRAYIVRIPGVPTALMPFYGPTPAEAARELSNWLTRAYERVSKPGGSV